MPSTQPSTARARRHDAILAIVAAEALRSQTALAERLAARGIVVNQATLSRDLRELGVSKGPDGYLPPADRPVDDLTRACRDWLSRATAVANQVVLHTPPGGAQPLALALDAATPDGLVGTLAGDDTVLAICASPSAAERLARSLLRRIA